MEPRIQYAKTKDGVSIAYATSGKCGNHVVAFIQAAMNHPPKYPSNPGHSRSDDGDGTIRSPARN